MRWHLHDGCPARTMSSEEDVEEVPFSIPDVIFKSLQLSSLTAVRDKWLHMYLSGWKHTVLNVGCVCLNCICAAITFWVKYEFSKLPRSCDYSSVIIPSNPISFMYKLCPAGNEGRGGRNTNSLQDLPHTWSFQLPVVTLDWTEVWSTDKDLRSPGSGFNRHKKLQGRRDGVKRWESSNG